MADFAEALEHVLKQEGGYTLTAHPADKGGRTYAGISEKANPSWPGWALLDGPNAPGRDAALKKMVEGRYRTYYWNYIQGDRIEDGDKALGLFSCAVLSGIGTCARLTQITLNELMRADLKVDGIVGDKTLDALNKVEPLMFLPIFKLARICRYSEIVDRHPAQAKWFRGWVNRVLEKTA